MSFASLIAKDVGDLLFPRYCIACNQRMLANDRFLCMHCWHDIPVTNFHLQADNPVAQLFWGRVRLEAATSWFAFKKGSRYQHLIHRIKYKGMKELGFEAGVRFGTVLLESSVYSQVDVLLPVPLHPRKEKKRGYNQCLWIARGMAFAMGKEVVSGNLVRGRYTETQTRKTRFKRWLNVEGVFSVQDPEILKGKHLLLIDDVVTTGATLEACAAELLKIGGVQVSVATLAFADF